MEKSQQKKKKVKAKALAAEMKECKKEAKMAKAQANVVKVIRRNMPKIGSVQERKHNAKAHSDRAATQKDNPGYLGTVLMNMQHPKGAGGVRICDTWTSKPTATMNPWMTISAPFAGSAPAPVSGVFSYFPQEQAWVVLTRSVMCSQITYNHNTGAVAGTYNLYMRGLVKNERPPPELSVTIIAPPGQTKIPFAYGLIGVGIPYHGTFLTSFTDGADVEGHRYFPAVSGELVVINATFIPTAGGAVPNVYLRYWLPEGCRDDQSVPLVPGTDVGINVSQTGYCTLVIAYSPQVSTSDAEQCVITINKVTLTAGRAGGLFCHTCYPSISGVVNTLQDFRMVGQSLFFQNSASVLNQAGNTGMVQLPPDDHWLNYISSTPSNGSWNPPDPSYGYDAITSQEDSITLIAAKGSYMWRKPADDTWSSFLKEIELYQGEVYDSHVNLQAYRPQLIWTSNIPAAGQLGKMTFASAIEMLTTDTTREVKPADGDSSELLRLQDAVRTMVQFSENPLHWAMIWQNIKKAISWGASAVRQHGPNIIRAAEKVSEFVD